MSVYYGRIENSEIKVVVYPEYPNNLMIRLIHYLGIFTVIDSINFRSLTVAYWKRYSVAGSNLPDSEADLGSSWITVQATEEETSALITGMHRFFSGSEPTS
jgi:hypothetical protein